MMIAVRLSPARIFFPALIYMISFCNSKNKSDTLSFNPEPGKVYQVSILRYSSSDYLRSNSKLSDHKLPADTLHFDGQLTRNNAKDSLVQMTFIITNLQLKTAPSSVVSKKNTGLPNYFDIRNKIFKLIAGTQILVTFNSKGGVEKVDGIEKAISGVYQKVKRDSAMASWASLINYSDRSMFHDYLSEEGITDLFNMIFYVLPAREVQPGDSWGNDFIQTARAPVKYSNLFTWKSDNMDNGSIHMESVISATTGEGGKTYMKGKRLGEGNTNVNTGLPITYQSTNETVTTTDASQLSTTEKLTVTITSKQ
jgi:hypothetical protein